MQHLQPTKTNRVHLAELLFATSAVISNEKTPFHWHIYDNCIIGHFLRALLGYTARDIQLLCMITAEYLVNTHGIRGANWSHVFFLLEAAGDDGWPEAVRFMISRTRMLGVDANFVQALEAMSDEGTLIACDFPSLSPDVLHKREAVAKYMRTAAQRVAEGHWLSSESFFELPEHLEPEQLAECPYVALADQLQAA